ncbi:unnamed protein product [Dovyalis caffra]|uniref:Uncharacterized protein n=1 Tax=Dovyalis caffra TaxID=77055 RepID=A0AAV1RC52_9ROSI|nr:unnamed protein product [Dovyalis caffra]
MMGGGSHWRIGVNIFESRNGGNSSIARVWCREACRNKLQVLENVHESISSGSGLVDGHDSKIPIDTPENVEPRRKWKIKCRKALFALRTSISKEFIDHVRDVKSPKEVWETLERSVYQEEYS